MRIDELDEMKEDPSFYGGDTLRETKQDKIQQTIDEYGFDALLTLKSDMVRYATDFFTKGYRAYSQDIEYLALIPNGGDPVLGYASGSDEYITEVKCLTEDTRKIDDWVAGISTILEDYELTDAKIGVDLLPYSWVSTLENELPGVEFVDASDAWTDITVIKHPIEIEYIREAVQIVEKGMRAAMDAIEPGIREIEVEAEVDYALRKAGTEVQWGIFQIASGKNSAIFERISTEKKIREGELVILDVNSLNKGYFGDLGRTVVCGEPTEKQKEIFDIQRKSLGAAMDAVEPGVKCSEVDAAAREAIQDAGYGKYMHKYATGHQVGYGVHGTPLIAPGQESTLEPGMVVALEPRVHLFDQWDVGGVHNEEILLVTDDGSERLANLGYDSALAE